MKNDFFRVQMWHFSLFFVKFWGTKLKPFSRKANRSLQNGFILKFARESILEIDFEATLKSKTNVLSVWKWIYIYIFFLFAHFLVNKLKMFLRKAGQSTQNCVNPKSDIVYILENGFETTLRSKADVLLNLWKRQISVFCTFLSHEVETANCESKAKRSKVFESIFDHSKHFRKWFRSNQVKPECSEPLKRAFFSFLHIFEWRSWNNFQEKWTKMLKTI